MLSNRDVSGSGLSGPVFTELRAQEEVKRSNGDHYGRVSVPQRESQGHKSSIEDGMWASLGGEDDRDPARDRDI